MANLDLNDGILCPEELEKKNQKKKSRNFGHQVL